MRTPPQKTHPQHLKLSSHGEVYVGQTNDLARRLEEHNDPDFKGTLHTKRRRGPWRLIHSEEFRTRSQAMRREKALKSSRGRAWIREGYVN